MGVLLPLVGALGGPPAGLSSPSGRRLRRGLRRVRAPAIA